MKARIIAAAVLSLMLLVTSASAEEEQPPLVLGTAPTSSVDDTKKAYAQMISYLTRVIGRRVVLQPAENYQEYQVKMRNGEYDLAFDGPPFVSWRMERMRHVPLVKLPAEIRIIVIKREDSKFNTLEELAINNVNTCVVPPPNTLTLIFLHYFPHPARQPNLLPIEGFKNIENCIRSGKGEVAVFRDIYWKKMDQTGLKVMYEPGIGYPERAVSAGPRVSEELRIKITKHWSVTKGLRPARKSCHVFSEINSSRQLRRISRDSPRCCAPFGDSISARRGRIKKELHPSM